MKTHRASLNNIKETKKKALSWACDNYAYVFEFRNNGYDNGYINQLFASNNLLDIHSIVDFKTELLDENVCGFINYDLKNDIENLESNNQDPFKFNNLSFISAETKITYTTSHITIEGNNPNEILQEITNIKEKACTTIKPIFHPTTEKNDYIKTVQTFKNHIVEGDIYEACYCMEFLSPNTEIEHPEILFDKLCNDNPKPFASFVKNNDLYLIGASPERFLYRNGNTVTSQPIKGTIKRSSVKEEDELLKKKLFNDVKERSENLMIVDLVRNDLAKISTTGTVQVEELFGIYTFPNVHQMISTITSKLEDKDDFGAVIQSTFPMGSMTGAPKIKAMELIEKYETFKRGLYSGSVGYFTEDGFDFNVVIRSLQYNSETKTLGLHVGSAITFESNAENEYKECLLKAKSLFDLFT